MNDLLNKAKQHATEIADRATAGAADLKEQAAAKAGELRETSTTKVIESVNALNTALPILKEAGFEVSGVSIELGLPPCVSAAFAVAKEISEEKLGVLLEEHAEQKLTVLLLTARRQAWRLQSKVHIVGMSPRTISVQLGLPPSVTVSFH